MSGKYSILILLNVLIFQAGICGLVYKHSYRRQSLPPPQQGQFFSEIPPEKIKPKPNYTIPEPVPAWLNYEQTVEKLQTWAKDAPELTEFGTYGKSKQGRDLCYLRIRGPEEKQRPVVLLTAAIHGNEPWASSVLMGVIGTLLDRYGDDDQITKLIDERDIYFVPIISPDAYPQQREIEGVDPNRNFPDKIKPGNKPVTPIQAIMDFHSKIKPNAVISGHTYGRIYLYPWGDTKDPCPNDADYKRILGKMSKFSQYNVDRACNNYGHPIYGTEVDWYYANGSLSVVMEMGTHQRPPSHTEITSEFTRTLPAIVCFIDEAPLVHVPKTGKIVIWKEAEED